MKPKILLTGASGSMGGEAFKELFKRKDKYDIVLFLLPQKLEKKKFLKYESADGIELVWGDLTNSSEVVNAVAGVDIVLHPAAFIAPRADHNPELAERINVGGTKNILEAIKQQPNGAERIKLVYISSIAVYGDRLPPVSLIRTGDPLQPSVYDFYATTKIRAERAVIESGIVNWVVIRQTYIAIPDALGLMDPIMFHQPIDQRVELVTSQDAGFGLIQTLDAPDDFWGQIYNMSGGPTCQFVFLKYIEHMMKMMGLPDYRKIMERNWFCTRNFHCGWYSDSHLLNGYLNHWRQTLDDHYQQVMDARPWYAKFGKIAPARIIKRIMKKMVCGKDGTLYWIESNNQGRISAFWGSQERWDRIPDWDIDMPDFDAEAYLLDHGYDENKPIEDLTINDMKKAATFRGGECVSEEFNGMSHQLQWKCAFEHEFSASPTLILKAGHWCPKCLAPPWDFDRIAKKNPFFAQVYYTNHDEGENHFYDEKCYEDIL